MNEMKFDGVTRLRLIQIVSEGIRNDETIETVDRIEEFLLTPKTHRCKQCENSKEGVKIDSIPTA